MTSGLSIRDASERELGYARRSMRPTWFRGGSSPAPEQEHEGSPISPRLAVTA